MFDKDVGTNENKELSNRSGSRPRHRSSSRKPPPGANFSGSQILAAERTMTSQASSKGGATNYGERLYNQALMKKEEKEKMIR